MPGARSLRGLDGLNFFVANVQTGFGPFIAVYLTTKSWTQAEIGEALSLGTAVAMLSQLPGGALVDRMRDKRQAAAWAGVAVAVSAVLFAAAPIKPVVMLAEVLHSCASALLGPAIAAITLALVGYSGLGERLGRNARYASLGNGGAAALLGAVGTYWSSRAVFWLTAALMAPALASLWAIRAGDVMADRAAVARPAGRAGTRSAGSGGWAELGRALADWRLLLFAVCAALFQLANAALLPLAASNVTKSAGNQANLLVAACIILPQAMVAVLSPYVGRAADGKRRRLVLLLGFAAVPLRAVLLALLGPYPAPLVLVQGLDGVSASVLGIMLPLIVAELTQGTGRFNLSMGVVGLAMAGGATASTLLAGVVADRAGEALAYYALAVCGSVAMLGAVGFASLPVRRPGGGGAAVAAAPGGDG